MSQKQVDKELAKIEKENAIDVLKKILSGVFVLLLVGFIVFGILFLILYYMG